MLYFWMKQNTILAKNGDDHCIFLKSDNVIVLNKINENFKFESIIKTNNAGLGETKC